MSEAHVNFFLKFVSVDQKKGLHPKLHPVDTDGLPVFRAQFSLERGLIHSLAGREGILFQGTIRRSVLAYKFKGEGQKKAILGFVSAFTSVFHPGAKLFTRAWGWGHKQYFWGHRPRNALLWNRACSFFCSRILAWRA